jgi:tRNA(fMet)-specific endonuclease VapC
VIYLLDTDHNSILQRGGAGVLALQHRLNALGQDDYGTSIVSFEEQCKGWTDYINRATTSDIRIEGYTRLRACLRFYNALAVWDYDVAADAIFVALTKAKVRVGTKDLRIASIALANDATLLTRNTRDFARVPNLRFEDWSV